MPADPKLIEALRETLRGRQEPGWERMRDAFLTRLTEGHQDGSPDLEQLAREVSGWGRTHSREEPS